MKGKLKIKNIIIAIIIVTVTVSGLFILSKIKDIGESGSDKIAGDKGNEGENSGDSSKDIETTTLKVGDGRVVTYFPGWAVYSAEGAKKYEVKDIPWEKITQVNHAFFEVKENGEIASTDKWSDFENTQICPEGKADWGKYPQTGYPDGAVFGHFGAYKYYKEKYPDVKILIAVGGWTRSNNFHEVAKDPAKRKAMANSMIQLMKTYPFIDGYDIDWEYPGESRESSDQWDRGAKGGKEDKENFTLLLKDIRESFNNNGMKDKMLTVAVSADPKKIDNTEPNKYHQYVDFIGVMTYDFAGAWDKTTGHLASIKSTKKDPVDGRGSLSLESVLNLFNEKYKVPKNKLFGGAPTYSRGWSEVEAGPNGDGLYQSGSGNYAGNLGPGGQFRWFDVKKLEGDAGWKKYRDKETKTPYLYNSSTKHFLTYEDEESLKERCNFLIDKGYGGMIIWDASGDNTNGYPMHSIVFDAFGNRNSNNGQTNKPNEVPKDDNNNGDTNSDSTSTKQPNEEEKKPSDNDQSNKPVSSGTWNTKGIYTVGDRVTYNGKSYKCIQGHTAQQTWDPVSAPSLWETE